MNMGETHPDKVLQVLFRAVFILMNPHQPRSQVGLTSHMGVAKKTAPQAKVFVDGGTKGTQTSHSPSQLLMYPFIV